MSDDSKLPPPRMPSQQQGEDVAKGVDSSSLPSLSDVASNIKAGLGFGGESKPYAEGGTVEPRGSIAS